MTWVLKGSFQLCGEEPESRVGLREKQEHQLDVVTVNQTRDDGGLAVKVVKQWWK